MTCAFDDEQPKTLISAVGPEAPTGGGPDDGYKQREFTLRRTRPFETMTLKISMYCPLISPSYPTSNLDTVGFKQLSISTREVNGDFMNPAGLAPEYHVEGLRGLEHEGARAWRWGVGGQTVLRFPLDGAQQVRLRYGFFNHMDGQSVDVVVNGQPLRQEHGLQRGGWEKPPVSGELVFAGKNGDNTVEFVFSKVNHVNASMSDNDATPYTVAFTELAVEPLGAGTAKP